MSGEASTVAGGYAISADREPGEAGRWRLFKLSKLLLPEEKSLQCCHRTISSMSDGSAELVYERRLQGDGSYRNRAYFAQVHRCGSVWVCPICAFSVSTGRRNELAEAMAAAKERGWDRPMITTTTRHVAGMACKDTLDQISAARRKMTSWRAYKELMQDFGRVGEVRALEVTHGENGWHPHFHAVTYFERELTATERLRLRRRLFCLWYRACVAQGLPAPDYKHGVNIQTREKAEDYTAKWGLAEELTKGHLKTAKKDKAGRTPWELLRDSEHDQRSRWLFREYAAAFKGRRQLVWSRGLAAKLGLGPQASDEELAQLELDAGEGASLVDVPDRALLPIAPEVWLEVCRQNAEAKLLAAARAFGLDGAREVLWQVTGGRTIYERPKPGDWLYWPRPESSRHGRRRKRPDAALRQKLEALGVSFNRKSGGSDNDETATAS